MTVTVTSGQTYSIAAGETVSDINILSSGTLNVISGGIASNTLVQSGGQETIFSGSIESGGTVSDGLLTVSSGGSAVNVTVEANTLVSPMVVESGGVASGTLISATAVTVISGSAVNTTIYDGGYLRIYSGGVASGTIISGPQTSNGNLESLWVSSGGAAYDTTISHEVMVVDTSAYASGITLDDTDIIIHGTADNLTALASPDIQVIRVDSGILSGAFANSNAVVAVYDSGEVYNDTVTDGGVEQIVGEAGGNATSYDADIQSGGVLSAYNSGASVISATVEAGGLAQIMSSAVASSAIIYGSMTLDSNGSATETTVLSGGQMTVGDPSISINAIVSSGGSMVLSSGGIASNTLVQSGGQETIFSGSIESGGTVSGGILTVSSGGSASSVTLESGGTLTVLNDAQAATVTIDSGTLALSGTNASATSVTLDSAGEITVADGAILSGGTYTAGTITAQSGGTLENTLLSGAVTATASSGGTASSVTLQDGASLTVSSGGTGQGTVLNSGTLLRAVSGATISGTSISSGALLQTDNAVTSTDTYLASGGSIELLDTSWSSKDTVSFANNILTIDDNGTLLNINLSAADDVYLSKDFVLSQADTDPLHANSNDILVTLAPVACFCRGTLIETEFGPMLIENILEKTKILTINGTMESLQWKGVRRYNHKQIALAAEIRPLVIEAHALGNNLPKRNLRVSQMHMLYIDNILVPASALINDRTIYIEQTGSPVEYYHLDIGKHNIIFAEGVATESLTDDDQSRRGFDNYDQAVSTLPSSPDVVMAAPLVREGEIISILQERYAHRASVLNVDFQRSCADLCL